MGMNQTVSVAIGGVIALLLVAAVGLVLVNQSVFERVVSNGESEFSPDPDDDSVACPADAKTCPDGSTVGRTGPECEFAECDSEDLEPSAPPGQAPQELPDGQDDRFPQVTVLAQGNGAGIAQTSQRTQVIFTQEQLQEVVREIQAENSLDPSSVDFTQQAVIAAFAGQQPTGGYQLRLQDLQETDEQVQVTFGLLSPGAGCITTQALTSPYLLISLPNTGKQFVTSFQTIPQDCE